MWHKLFRSKSAKLSTSSSTLSNVSTTTLDENSLSTCSSSNESTATVKSKNSKISNAFKRVGLKRAHSSSKSRHNVSTLEQLAHHEQSKDSSCNNNYNNAVAMQIEAGQQSYHAVNDRSLTTFTTFRVGSAGIVSYFS